MVQNAIFRAMCALGGKFWHPFKCSRYYHHASLLEDTLSPEYEACTHGDTKECTSCEDKKEGRRQEELT